MSKNDYYFWKVRKTMPTTKEWIFEKRRVFGDAFNTSAANAVKVVL